MKWVTWLLLITSGLNGGEYFMQPLLDDGNAEMGLANNNGLQSSLFNPALVSKERGVSFVFSPGYRDFGLKGFALSWVHWPGSKLPSLHIISENHEFMQQNSVVVSGLILQDSLYTVGLALEYDDLNLLGSYYYRNSYLNGGMQIRLTDKLNIGFSYLRFISFFSDGKSSPLRYPEYRLNGSWNPVESVIVSLAIQKDDTALIGLSLALKKQWNKLLSSGISYDHGSSSVNVSMTVSKGHNQFKEVFLWHPFLGDLHAFSFSRYY